MPPHFFVAADGCSFCGATIGKTRTRVPASASSARICDECLARCCDIVEGQRSYARAPAR